MKQLAIIKNPYVATEDHSDKLCIMFDSYISESGAALQIVSPGSKEFYGFWRAMAGNVKNLEGKAVWVESDGSMIKLIGVAEI